MGKKIILAVVVLVIGMTVSSSSQALFDKKLGEEVNNPPSIPIITGPDSVVDGEYMYSFASEGPDGDNVHYTIFCKPDSEVTYDDPYESVEDLQKSHTWNEKGTREEVFPVFVDDELDQYQTDYYGFNGMVGNVNGRNCSKAQSFIPTKKVLTRVELYIAKEAAASHPYVLAIRDNLTGENIAMVSVNSSEIPVYPGHEWIEFDFDDVSVTVGQTYYIISYTANVTNNKYYWGEILYDGYPNGTAYSSNDNGVTWEHPFVADMCFKTYGRGSNILYVGGNGSGNYSSIQAAIDNASNGDTVFVYSGTYYENIVIDRSISLVGEDKYSTIIDGGRNDDVVDIVVDSVYAGGFTIQNGSLFWYATAGVRIKDSAFNIVENNIVQNNDGGIWTWGGNANIISNNVIKKNSKNAVWLDGTNNVVNNNSITDNGWDGIGIFGCIDNLISNNSISNSGGNGIYVTRSVHNRILNNTINNGKSGIFIVSTMFNIVENNKVTNSTFYYGLSLGGSYNKVSNNVFINNTDRGIVIHNSSHNLISNNVIKNSKYSGLHLTVKSTNNSIIENTFLKNPINAIFSLCKNNYWDGNYWNRPRFLPKPIFGFYLFPRVEFDWHPAKEPYELT